MNCNKVKEQFKSRSETFDSSARWVTDEGLLVIHQKLAEVSCGDLILEACCGTGLVGKILCADGSTVVGLDLSPHMLDKAKVRLNYCVNGQMEHLPFSDNVFDILICRQALHFLALKEVVREMFRVIKGGNGRIIISQIVPFGSQDSAWLYEIHRKKQPILINFLQEEDIKDLLKETGFVDIISQEYLIEEPINSWLNDTNLTQAAIDEIKKMFINAPSEYKALHRTRVFGNEIFDTMRWVILRARKNA
jgi:ubiquinone/menaquinone biosynthesis C-methylase UbiE